MSVLLKLVSEEKNRIMLMIAAYETELSALPKGTVIAKTIKGNLYYYLQYRNGKDEKTKLWHLSPIALYDLFHEEQQTGKITFPEEA